MKTTTIDTAKCPTSTWNLIPWCPPTAKLFPPQSIYAPKACK